MNKLSGYKKGDKVEVKTKTVYAGTPGSGEAFETWTPGIVVGEGFTSINAYGDDDQQSIIIKTEDGNHIRAGSQLR